MRTNTSSHRWLSRALLVLAGCVLSGTCGIVRAAPTTQPSGEEIFNKFIDATGGKAAYDKVKSRIAHGKVEVPAQGVSGTIVLYFKSPNSIRVEVEVPGVEKAETVFNGKDGWEKSAMRGTRLLKGEELEQLKQQADTDAQLDWHKLYKSVTNDGIVDMDGTSVYKVSFAAKSGKNETRFYDTQTNLLDAIEMDSEIMGAPAHVSSKLTDYREVDGVKMPFVNSMTMGINGMEIEQKISIEKIESADIPAEKFVMPDDVKELTKKPATTQPSK